MSQLLKVGKIANTHGLKGEVKVIALTDNPKRFKDLAITCTNSFIRFIANIISYKFTSKKLFVDTYCVE